MKIRVLVLTALAVAVLAAAPGVAAAARWVPGEAIVKFEPGTSAAERAAAAAAADTRIAQRLPAGSAELRATSDELRLADTLASLRADPRVRYAVPNAVARATAFVPNDTGFGTEPGRWQELQWNFASEFGVNAPDAWSLAIAAGAPGGRGVTVAVLDTGVAYTNRGRFRRNPDLYPRRFTKPYDFVDDDRYPNDENGHGTHVTGTIAQKTNNNFGATGLAYGVTVMPLRVLDAHGEGDAGAIARAIRYAARNGAKVINMSLEFDSSITSSQIPDIIAAVRYAHRRGSIVVGAAGNAAETAVAYPARTSHVISVGGITEHGCQADYSNSGTGLDVVAPGGGSDAPNEDNQWDFDHCRAGEPGRDIYQVTFTRDFRAFSLPSGFQGTSMAAPHVSAVAALIVATKMLGANPRPQQVEARLKATARDLGPTGYDRRYGYGLIDARAALTR